MENCRGINHKFMDSEYHDAMLDLLEWIWGKDYMAPGGEGNIDKLVAGLDLRGKRVLDSVVGLAARRLPWRGLLNRRGNDWQSRSRHSDRGLAFHGSCLR